MRPIKPTAFMTPNKGPDDPPKKDFLSKATEKRDIDYAPSIQLQRLDSIDSNVRSKNPYFGNKEEVYVPFDFYSDWLNSEMYKRMMDGKESIHDKMRPIPSSIYKDDEESTQNIIQKFGYKPGLDGKVSITDARRQNLENTEVENYALSDFKNMVSKGEYISGGEYKRDSDGNIISSYPKVKLQNPKYKTSTGQSISFDDYLSTLVHELSHASDVDILNYDGPNSTWDAIYYEARKERRGEPVPEGTFGLEERTGGYRKALIPSKDVDLINSFVEKNREKNLKGHYPEYTRNRDLNWRYYTDPTEVRARVNSQRYDLFKKGIFNPFSQKMTQKKLDEIRKDTIKSGSKNMKDLFNFFSDDQIIKMFNSIAMEETGKSKGRILNFA
tara:strand:- start:5621 stop:6775 length:1155 start_codon:yes stop_codon:yes gene_type:complete